MDAWTSISHGDRNEIWVALTIVIALLAVVVYPLKYAIRQRKFRYQISSNLATTGYKLPFPLTPAELAYLFSPRMGKRHMYASIMQLLNTGTLVSEMERERLKISVGPRVDSKMALSDGFIVDLVEQSEDGVIFAKDVADGQIEYRVPSTHEKISGSRQYVFWWLVRESLRQQDIIVKKSSSSYVKVVIKAWLLLLLNTILIVGILSITIMVLQGEIDLSNIGNIFVNSVIWIPLFIPVTLLLAFISLRLRGKFIGREWILSGKKKRLLGQFDAYREYIRLVQLGQVPFESDHAAREAKRRTLPYAVALGYAPIDKMFSE